ncbi:MAG TPA: aspartyl/glutamyl-tRNA amidotransferase subunit C, partial [Deltaproteobacteria bacterium]|nr:aspartyl/glutamyl-tRNA amidotransferase subunit C [Deltaproteobacteria bacterium]
TNAFRQDEEAGHLDRDAVLKNAPDKDENDGSFLVPKVVG